MKINVEQQSDLYIGGWWVRKGERYIANWLTIYDEEQKWFDREMTKRFGRSWRAEQDMEDLDDEELESLSDLLETI